MPVRSRQQAAGEISMNSKVEHQGAVRLFLPACTSQCPSDQQDAWNPGYQIAHHVYMAFLKCFSIE
jgi:hypothetical protein